MPWNTQPARTHRTALCRVTNSTRDLFLKLTDMVSEAIEDVFNFDAVPGLCFFVKVSYGIV